MQEKMYGYVRVSSKDQNEARQLLAMKEFGVPPEMIVCEKQSGKDFLRPLYQKMIRKMRAGDTLVIKSIDRETGRIFVTHKDNTDLDSVSAAVGTTCKCNGHSENHYKYKCHG